MYLVVIVVVALLLQGMMDMQEVVVRILSY